MHYRTQFIDELLSKVNLYELFKLYGLQVKDGSGNNAYYVASWCCGKTDFDNGRIKKDRQTYKCNACMSKNEGGKNAIHFLREYAGLSFQEAVQQLCRLANMGIPKMNPAVMKAQKRKERVLQLTADFYHAQKNFVYFLSRGIAEEVLMQANAGYAPRGYALRTYLEQKGLRREELADYKLINAKGLDTFFNRAVIPVYRFGKVIDLYGRAIDQTKARIKHFYLYGYDVLGGYDRLKKDQLISIYESAIDRLAAESYGFVNGVDPGGAKKFTASHARLLRKKSEKAVVIFDGDKAGREGALLTGQLLVKEGFQVWIVELSEGLDPAQILKDQGKDAFLSQIQGGKTFEQYKMYHELSKYPLAEIEKYIKERSAVFAEEKLKDAF